MYIYIVVPVDAPKLLLFDFKRILFKIKKLKHFGGVTTILTCAHIYSTHSPFFHCRAQRQ